MLNNRQYSLRRCTSVVLLMVSAFSTAWAETVAATLQWSRRVELSTPVSGVVKEVLVEQGERVKKGAVMLRLDEEVFKAKFSSAQAAHKGRDVQYQEARRELDRHQELYNRTLLSEHELQVAKNAFELAKSDLERARAAQIQAKQELNYSVIHAPFNAWVLSRNAEAGKVISAEIKPETLLIIADADHMLARAYVSESRLAQLKKGMTVTVHVGSRDIKGQIKSIALEPESKTAGTVEYAIDIEFATGDMSLRSGQQASVDLP